MKPLQCPGGRARFAQVAFCLLLGAVIQVLLLPSSGLAREEVTATYTQSAGTVLTVEIRIGPAPPASLILVQRLPPGVRLVNGVPPANNFNGGSGEAKWLLSDIAPGTRTIRMTLDRAVNPADISAEIRYNPARGGGMQTLTVTKP